MQLGKPWLCHGRLSAALGVEGGAGHPILQQSYTPLGLAAVELSRIHFQRSWEGNWEIAPRQNQLQIYMSLGLSGEDDPKEQLFPLSEL